MIMMSNAMMGAAGYAASGELILVAGKGLHPGVVTASSTHDAPRGPDKMFDNSLDDISGCWHSSNSLPQWVLYDFGDSRTIKRYGISKRSAGSDDETNGIAPYSWTFEGSHDGLSFTTLDQQIYYLLPQPPAEANVADEYFGFFDIGNPSAYRYYRLHITEQEPVGLFDYIAIGELAFYE